MSLIIDGDKFLFFLWEGVEVRGEQWVMNGIVDLGSLGEVVT